MPLAERLADPARYGGDPAGAFDVVVPSLPGFVYSEPASGPLTRAKLAETSELRQFFGALRPR